MSFLEDVNPAGRNLGDLITFGAVHLFTRNEQAPDGNGSYASESLYVTDGTEAGTRPVARFERTPGHTTGSLVELATGVTVGTAFYFAADDGIHGLELWRTDGTAVGTRLVADTKPGPGGSEPGGFAALGSTLLFAADDGTHGREPWRTSDDGRSASLLADIAPGTEGSQPDRLTTVAANVYFETDASGGYTLWKTDGTADGTRPVLGPADGLRGQRILATAALDGLLLFETGWKGSARTLWRTDGTAQGTFVLKGFTTQPFDSPLAYIPDPIVIAGSTAFIRSSDRRELWRTDGTIEGTSLAASSAIVPDQDPVYWITGYRYVDYYWGIGDYAAINSRLVFAAAWDFHSSALFSLDPSSLATVQLASLDRPEPTWSWVPRYDPTVAFDAEGAILYVLDDRAAPTIGWATDGTPGGTLSLGPLGARDKTRVIAQPDGLWFETRDADGPNQLRFRSLSESAGRTVWTFTPDVTASSNPEPAGALGSDALFWVRSGTGPGWELWRSDGTPGSTRRLASDASTVLTTDGSQLDAWQSQRFRPAPLVAHVGNRIVWLTQRLYEPPGPGYFMIGYPSVASTLWSSDGTPEGTSAVVSTADAFGLIERGGRALFRSIASAGDVPGGVNLWSTDGTIAGTRLDVSGWPRLVLPPQPADTGPIILGAQIVGGVTFDLSLQNGELGLWRSDGAGANPRLVRDLGPAADGNSGTLDTVAGRLVIRNTDGLIWTSDGTPSGTTLLADFQGPVISGGRAPLRVGDRLWFIRSTDGRLWSTDGTPGETEPIRAPGLADLTDLQSLSVVNVPGGAFVAAGGRLWASDGTTAGTTEQTAAFGTAHLASVVGLTTRGLLFAARDPIAGTEPFLWTDAPVFPARDVTPRVAPLPSPTVRAGTPLSLSLLAASPSHHRLIFTLDPGAPPGATVDPDSGRLNWTPSTPGTHRLSIRVSDAATPEVSTQAQVTVTVLPPRVLSVELALRRGRVTGLVLHVDGPADPGVFERGGLAVYTVRHSHQGHVSVRPLAHTVKRGATPDTIRIMFRNPCPRSDLPRLQVAWRPAGSWSLAWQAGAASGSS